MFQPKSRWMFAPTKAASGGSFFVLKGCLLEKHTT